MSILVVGGMTIDDLVLETGDVHRRVPGGNALYSALGARLWGVTSEIVSFVGGDYPSEVLQQLEESGIGIAHVARLDTTSVRLWILYEEDGRRQIHLQHGSAALGQIENIASTAIDKILSIHTPGGAHIAALPVRVQRTIATRLKASGVPFTLDSLEAKGSVGGDLSDYLVGSDLGPQAFLPSRAEFGLLFGDESSASFRTWSQNTPTSILVIKDGHDGSVVAAPPHKPGVRLPAIDCNVVDPTGAGDAYCGGFAAGMSLGHSAVECAAMGTVAASFVVEGVGARALSSATTAEAHRRRNKLANSIGAQ